MLETTDRGFRSLKEPTLLAFAMCTYGGFAYPEPPLAPSAPATFREWPRPQSRGFSFPAYKEKSNELENSLPPDRKKKSGADSSFLSSAKVQCSAAYVGGGVWTRLRKRTSIKGASKVADRRWSQVRELSVPRRLIWRDKKIDVRSDDFAASRPRVCIDRSTRMATILNTARPDPAFDPEAITVLAAAFNEAWDRLRQSGSECVRPAYARAMKEILARRIIEMAQRGTTDQQELVAGATRFIATNYRLKTISPDIPVRPGTVLQVDADSA